MTQDQETKAVPRIEIGIGVFPIMLTNFVTDQDGGNEVVKQLQLMHNTIMDETVAKIYSAVQMYCMMQGIDVVFLDGPDLMKHIRFMTEHPELTDVKGVYDQERGEHNLDPDFLKHTASGRRTDS